MTSVRTLALVAALMTASAVAANAQAGWPNSQPQAQSAWPSSSPQPQAQGGWPNSAPPAQQQQQQAASPNSAPAAPAAPPQQAPWPASAPPGQMAAPPMGGGFGGGGGGFGGPPPSAQQECMAPFGAMRAEVEKRGLAARAGAEKQVAREELCKLVTAYSAAEAKWVKFAETNMAKCGIPKEIVHQLKTVHAKTADSQKRVCAAGPAGGPAAAPTLSDALGTATLPTREPEKRRKPGGTLDTLTGNALGQ